LVARWWQFITPSPTSRLLLRQQALAIQQLRGSYNNFFYKLDYIPHSILRDLGRNPTQILPY
jgi:hypothetical protein